MDKKYETRDITGRSALRSRKDEPFLKIIMYTVINSSIKSICINIFKNNIIEFKALDMNNSPKKYKCAYMKILKEGS